MRNPTNHEAPLPARRTNDWGVAAAIAFSIVICLATFVWIFVELDPFMDDFTGSDSVVTPGPDDPLRVPADGTDGTDPVETP